MSYPDQLRYTKDHEWIRLEGDIATVGITHFAQGELGDIVYVEIETLGKALPAEAVFGTVEAVKTVSDLFLPVLAFEEWHCRDCSLSSLQCGAIGLSHWSDLIQLVSRI